MKQALIIGAGISGITAGRILAENGYKVTIIEKRDHIGGNIYDYYEDEILIHKYGPHLFHTKMLSVADFVRRFSKFTPYEHRVLGEIDGKLVPIPFNFKSIDMLYSEKEAAHLKEVLSKSFPNRENVPIMELRQSEDTEVRALAEFVFQKVFYGYTKKQWGKAPEEMDPAVMGRVPVCISYDDRYFNDEFQMMPLDGYTSMTEQMILHPNISLRLNCDAIAHIQLKENQVYLDGEAFFGEVIYTGCIEDLLDEKYGKLPYRSLKFSLERHNVTQYQPVVQVNYPNRFSYTRISEFKLVQRDDIPDKTVISYEYPIDCGEKDIPYYPVSSIESTELYKKYRKELSGILNLHLLGRLAEYKYYNMDITIHQAMCLAEEILKNKNERK